MAQRIEGLGDKEDKDKAPCIPGADLNKVDMDQKILSNKLIINLLLQLFKYKSRLTWSFTAISIIALIWSFRCFHILADVKPPKSK